METGGVRRSWWLIGLAVASAVAVVAVVVPILARHGHHADPPQVRASLADGQHHWRWVSYRDLEVVAPAGWPYDDEASRPDCITDPADPDDPWARDVPRAPYVSLLAPGRVEAAIGCSPRRGPSGPDPAFGALPFVLWQPYVELDEARPDSDLADHRDGRWRYRGWHLTRVTYGQVQISVLSRPGDPALGTAVLHSVRRVRTTALGCDPHSPVQAQRFAVPAGAPVPPASTVAAVTICQYSRMPGDAGLTGSRRITGARARSVVEAINRAPAGGGPDDPAHCVSYEYGDTAIALRFFDRVDATRKPAAEAYVYYDWCFGNGIVDSGHRRRLTPANCSPLFAAPPISFSEGTTRVAAACWRKGA